MLYILNLILEVSSLSDYNTDCYQFSCTSQELTDLETPCLNVSHSTKEVQFSQCSTHLTLVCDYFQYYSLPESEWSNINCSFSGIISDDCSLIAVKVTGETCCSDINCVSNNCVDGLCAGLPLGSICNSTEECESTGYCLSNICTYTFPPGSACKVDEECRPGFGCNLSKCTKIFSLDLESETEFEKFCITNFMVDGKCTILTLSLEGSEYTLYSPFLCEEGDVCVYTLNNGTVYDRRPCKCAGYYNLPEGFCGDYLVHVVSVMDVVYSVLGYDQSKCAGEKVHSSDPYVLFECGSISIEKYLYYFNIFNQASYWNLFVTGSLDVCAKDFGLWDPFYTYRDYGFSAILLSGLSLILTL